METGARIGPYELVRELGRGGMGVVYEARREGAPPLALKLLLDQDPAFVRRFEQETRLLQALGRHPHVVRLFDAGEHGGRPYLVMPLLSGGTLADRIARGSPPLDAARLLVPIARALEVAHALGVVHRDLKPENVLIEADGSPCLADFGVAKDLRERTLTQTGAVVGSPAYMAPEQLDARGVDARTDVYALGAVLFHVLTGRPPFDGEGISILKQIVTDPPPRPRQLAPTVSPALEAVCLRALAKDPAARHPSAAAFARELDAALGGTPSPPPRGRASLLAASAVALAVGGVIGGVIAIRPWQDDAPPTSAPPRETARAESSDRYDVSVATLLEAAAGTDEAATLEQRAAWIERAAALDFEATLTAATEEHVGLLSDAALVALKAVPADGDAALAATVARARERVYLARLLDPERDLRPHARELARIGASDEAALRDAARPWAWPFEPATLARIQSTEVLEHEAYPPHEVAKQSKDDVTWSAPFDGWREAMALVKHHKVTGAALHEWVLWHPELPYLWVELGAAIREGDPPRGRRALEVGLERGELATKVPQRASFELAQTLVESGRRAAAGRVLAEMIARTGYGSKETNPAHLLYGGELLARTGSQEDARRALDYLVWLELNRKKRDKIGSESYWLARAQAHTVLGEAERAARALERAAKCEVY